MKKVLLSLSCLILCLCLVSCGTPKVEQEKASLVADGMTYSEVVELLGRDGEQGHRSDGKPVYRWAIREKDGFYLLVSFRIPDGEHKTPDDLIVEDHAITPTKNAD